MTNPSAPLVSVIIYNFNYGRYLRECFDSVLNQSYSQVEILFSDNASTDDSWEIAVEYSRRYPGKFFVARNRYNYGQHANQRNCYVNIRGKYFCILGSDDVLLPGYLEKTISHLEAHLDAGMAIVHKSTLNDSGQIIEEVPFYNQSCKIPAPKQAAVHMMATINATITQVIYRTQCSAETTMRAADIGTRYHGSRILDFDITCQHAALYIDQALVLHRVHGSNDGMDATENMMDVLGSYVMNFDFAEKADAFGLTEVSARLNPSIEKNAHLALRYALIALRQKNLLLAKRYWHLAYALHPVVENEALYQHMQSYFSQPEDSVRLQQLLEAFPQQKRQHSYAPPEGSLPL